MSGPEPDPIEQRLIAIEEHAAFTERTVEELSLEIAELGRRVQTLMGRVEALDERIRKALEPPDAVDPD